MYSKLSTTNEKEYFIEFMASGECGSYIYHTYESWFSLPAVLIESKTTYGPFMPTAVGISLKRVQTEFGKAGRSHIWVM